MRKTIHFEKYMKLRNNLLLLQKELNLFELKMLSIHLLTLCQGNYPQNFINCVVFVQKIFSFYIEYRKIWCSTKLNRIHSHLVQFKRLISWEVQVRYSFIHSQLRLNSVSFLFSSFYTRKITKWVKISPIFSKYFWKNVSGTGHKNFLMHIRESVCLYVRLSVHSQIPCNSLLTI